MSETIRFENALDIFQNTVTLYKDDEGKLHIGNTYFYNGRGVSEDYRCVMYRDALPSEMDLMLGWNVLDDTAGSQVIVPENSAADGVEDFCYAHGLEKSWKSLDYHVVDRYSDISSYMKNHSLENGEVTAFGIRRQNRS